MLGNITRSRLRLWQADGGSLRLACGDDPGWNPETPSGEGPSGTPAGPSWFTPVPEIEGLWLEIHGDGRPTGTPRAALAAPLIEMLVSSERDASRLWDELTVRYAEIDLLYAISEILGQTVRLEEAARTILRQVTRVVGARRASIMVFDDQANLLRVVASQGFDKGHAPALSPDDPHSIAARVFREQRVVGGDATQVSGKHGGGRHPGYKGNAFLSVPICYAAPGAPARCIGVINLTDSLDGDRFTPRDRKLVTAVANQIGAAIENARLAAREREQQRLEDELQLAHDLQLKLMPDPHVLKGEAIVAVRCVPVASVGGDFYTFLRQSEGRVGVMLGDVSSHGMSAALMMALVLSAAGIHTAAATGPAETLHRLRESLLAKLSEVEMFATAFYGVLDRKARTLFYANAGHPHAFRITGDGVAERLEATAMPLGLGTWGPIAQATLPWDVERDLLILFTDGLADAADAEGARFGEARLMERLTSLRDRPPEEIVDAVMSEVDQHSTSPADDRTLLVLHF